jgi:hypothetical protein
MNDFTNAEYTDMVLCYRRASGNSREAQRMYRAPRNVIATFTQSVTRWHFRKAKFVQSCNIQFLNFFKRIC